MNRRVFVGGLASGIGTVAGCLGARREPPPKTTHSTPSPTPTVPRVTVEADESPPEERVNWTVSVEKQFSMATPARIEIAFTNEAETARTFEFGTVAPFAAVRGSGPTALLLVPRNDSISVVDENDDGDAVLIPDDPGENCWQAEDRLILPDVLRTLTLDSGETLRETYDVAAPYDASGCLPSGKYRFSQQLEEVTGENGTESMARWGFSLTISRP